MYTIHEDDHGYLVKRWISGECGVRLLYTARADDLDAARQVVPDGMICLEREHYDPPSLLEAWSDGFPKQTT